MRHRQARVPPIVTVASGSALVKTRLSTVLATMTTLLVIAQPAFAGTAYMG